MAKQQFKPKTSGATVLDTVAPDEVKQEDTVIETSVETVEEKTDEVTANENIVQKPVVKNVKILPNCDHTCSIGGTRYFLKKGVQTNVPQEVKDILNKSGLLMPL
jgi:hypothetical protein